MLKHIAAHNAPHAFAAVERVIRPELEAVPSSELAHTLGIAVLVDRFEPTITRLSPI
ncbi:MAG TPA: hypothetical protein VKG65_07525 [Terriglobales bacterium]|nr:hypothetical protein [Terriglobales bacterium]